VAYNYLTTRRDGAVEYLTLNRPEVRNAFNAEMIAELADWAAATGGERDVRAVVVGGVGKTFSAGADVTWMAKTIRYTEEQNLADATATSRMFAAIDQLRMPVIGRVQGAALGGGAGLAAVCDIVVAEEGAVFGFTEVKLGILPAVISPFALAKIGRSAARELFLTGSCMLCHAVQGTSAQGRRGPDLTHFASRAHIGAGSVANTPEALARWIEDPQKLKPGANMPSHFLPPADLAALVAYLETLT